jgi:hypothetical protein
MAKDMPGYTRSELTDEGCVLLLDGRTKYRLIPVDVPEAHYRAVFFFSGNGASPEGYTRWSREDVLAIPIEEK